MTIRLKSKKAFTKFTETFIGLAILWSGYSVFVLLNAEVYAENNLLENLQALTIVAIFAVFMVSVFQSHRADRLLGVFFAWLAVAFFLREVDMDRLGLPAFFEQWGAGSGRDLLLMVTLAAIVIPALLRWNFYIKLSKQFLVSASGVMTLLCGFLLIAGEICEKAEFPHHVLFEEVLESIAYIILLRAAVSFVRHEIAPKRVAETNAEKVIHEGFSMTTTPPSRK
ncbi:hypothetical protein [Congregibacter sp.]|jgi:hypothetical protein|uniref:hypothetical protein n=1 Tax=Congregibacter sp. TaxID=2744308 RepID=UPI0039E50FE4